MDITEQHTNRFIQALKKEDMRLTKQRMAILEDVLRSAEHRECDDIYLSLKTKGVSVSRATIYRTMDILEAIGFVRKMDIGDGRARYENKISQSHHDHIICIECGRILEFVDEEIERRQEEWCREHGFNLVHHVHQLHGICQACQRKLA